MLFIQYYSVICRPSDHTVGRPRAEIRTRAGWPRSRDTTPRPPHLLFLQLKKTIRRLFFTHFLTLDPDSHSDKLLDTNTQKMDADLLKINCYGRAIFPAFGNQLDTGYPYRSIPINLILKNTKNTGFIFCYKFKDPQHCPQPNKKTCLAAINKSIRVFPQVVEAATQPP